MVLKVLHQYLDECKVAFVAIANTPFDAAKANRMIRIYRSLSSEHDQRVLAYGCLGLKVENDNLENNDRLKGIIDGLCHGYRELLKSQKIPKIFHDRDFIYMLRELRFELTTNPDEQDTHIDGIKPESLLRALEDNFTGVSEKEFQEIVDIFFKAVETKVKPFRRPNRHRNVPTILEQSLKLISTQRRLYGRYKLLIDQSEDESAIRLLNQCGVLDPDPNKTILFRMSDFEDDQKNELRNVEILSSIKLCMQTGKTILMVNTGRIHGSFYDVFNQNFSIMSTEDSRKVWSKLAIGAKTIDVDVHEDFQCLVHINRSELKDIPAPFLSRFQKYSLSIEDFYRIQYEKLSKEDRQLMKQVEEKVQTFIHHFGQQFIHGYNSNTLYSCLLGLIEKNSDNENCYLNIDQQYTQLTIRSKPIIQENPTNMFQCVLRYVISRLMQLIPPEHILLKLPTFTDDVSRWICQNYFDNQEHFSVEKFCNKLVTPYRPEESIFDLQNFNQTEVEKIPSTTKVMIFTRTSSHIASLQEQTKEDFFSSLNQDEYTIFSEKVNVINMVSLYPSKLYS